MNTDVSTNVVVFGLRRPSGEAAVAEGPTQAEDCVRQAWAVASQRYQVAPSEVTAIHSEWEPSATDVGFMQATFTQATKVTYNFSRPAPDGWEAAFAAARQAMEQGAQRDVTDRAQQSIRHVNDDGDLQMMRYVDDHGQMLPVLWSHRSPKREMLELLPYHELVPGRIFVTLATVAPTPRGTIGMSHVTHGGLKGRSFDDLMAEAGDQLRIGLRVEGRGNPEEPEGGLLVTLQRNGPFAASAVALPDFYEHISDVLRADRLVAALPSTENLLVAPEGSVVADELRRIVLNSPCPDDQLVPTLLSLTSSGYTVLAERVRDQDAWDGRWIVGGGESIGNQAGILGPG